MNKSFFPAAVLVIISCACSQPITLVQNEPEPIVEAVQIDESVYIPLQIIYENKNTEQSLYEPEKGCYSGADIISDNMFTGDIKKFERYIGVKHAMYSVSMNLGDSYPEKFILSCIINQKTPSVTINPSPEILYDAKLLEKTAKSFALFNTPIFINFYPYSSESDFSAKEYINFFKYAKSLFSRYAPKVAFIWSISSRDVYDCNAFYPGDDFVDWVGINIRANIVKTATGYDYGDVSDSLDYFYFNYQKKKPIMLSELAISHYTTRNNKYENGKAIHLIEAVLSDIISKYPRIKAYVYMDRDIGTDNYLITDSEDIMSSYKTAASNSGFLSSIEESSRYGLSSLYHSVYNAQKRALDSAIFLPESSLIFDINCSTQQLDKINNDAIYINFEKHYPADSVERIFQLNSEASANSLFLYK